MMGLRRMMMAGNAAVATATFVGAAGSLTASGASINVPMPAGVEAGDLIIACVSCRGDRNASAGAGWTELADLRSGSSSIDSRLKVFATTHTGSGPSALVHSTSAAYGVVAVVARGGVIQNSSSDQRSADANTSIVAPSGALLVGFGSVNPRSTAGGQVPVGSQPGWTLRGTGAYVTSATLINYLAMAYSRAASGGGDAFVVGTDYGAEANRIGSVWGCAIY